MVLSMIHHHDHVFECRDLETAKFMGFRLDSGQVILLIYPNPNSPPLDPVLVFLPPH
jgi:hypothetical protein